MKKRALLTTATALMCSLMGHAQYDIKINFKGCKDTMLYLVKYTFDQQYVSDTCKNPKNGMIEFKGTKNLDKGVYTLVSQGKSVYFDFFINESQNFTILNDAKDGVNSLKSPNSKENDQFFTYIKYITNKNVEFNKLRDQTKGKSKEDSAKFMNENIKKLNDDVKKFEVDFMSKVKGTYLYDVLNLKTEKEWSGVPKNRADSVYQYYYYKSHFFDGVNFKDDRIIRTPFFHTRIKKYFDNVILMHPDTVIQEIDRVLTACGNDCNLVYKLLLGHFTYKYEQSKIMGFDKVFVHLADRYIINNKACGVYDEETIQKIRDRVNIMRGLLLGAKVKELYVIDTTDGKTVRKMGFDTATSSKSITDLYYKNIEKLTPMFKTLYSIKAKYTVLVFWAVDCSHCQTEIPKLHDGMKDLKGVDVKVLAVQTKDDLFETWKKFIIEKKLTNFINVFDPIHLNNLKESFDIYSTPVIYLLDSEKKIKAKRLDAQQVVDMIKALEEQEKQAK